MDILKYEPLKNDKYFGRRKTKYDDLKAMETTSVRRVTSFELVECKLDDGIRILAINPLGRVSVSGESGTYGGSTENFGSTSSKTEWLYLDVKPEEFENAVRGACERRGSDGMLIIDITREGLTSTGIRKTAAPTAKVA